MSKQFIAILTGLGLAQDRITELTGLTEDQLKDWKPDAIVTEIKGGMKTAFMNDQEFLNTIPDEKIPDSLKKKLESGQYARFQNELLEVATKKLGLDDKETFTDEDRKSIKKMAEKIAVTYMTKNGNATGLRELQQKLTEATQQLEAKDTEMTTKVEQAKATAAAEFGGKLTKMLTRTELASLKNIKLGVKPEFIVDSVIGKVKEKYGAELVVGENDTIHLRQKANPALEVMENNKTLSFNQALRNVVLENEFGTEEKEEGPGKNQPRKVVVGAGGDAPGTGDGVEVASYITDKIAANGDLPSAE